MAIRSAIWVCLRIATRIAPINWVFLASHSGIFHCALENSVGV